MSTEVVATTTEATDRPRLRTVLCIVFALCGVTLLIGFFLPWFSAGTVVSLSGFALVFASGEMVGMLAGSNRFMLIAIPVLGALLVGGSILRYRVTSWIAVGGALIILAYGFYNLMRMFLSTTGVGMWLVIIASLLALSFGFLAVGRDSRE